MLVLSCKRATELIEKKSLFQLSWDEQLQLRIHTKICSFCAIYQQQSVLLDKIIHHQMTEISEIKLVQEVKNERLKSLIVFGIDKSSF